MNILFQLHRLLLPPLVAVVPSLLLAAEPEIRFTSTRIRPAVQLLVTHQGQLRPVVAVKGKNPQVEIAGKQQTVRTDIFDLNVEGSWAPGGVAIANAGAFHVMVQGQDVDSGARLGGARYEGDEFLILFTPTQDYRDCFFALVYYAGNTSKREFTVYLRDLGDLKADKEHKIAFAFGRDWKRERVGRPSFPLFFSEGRQIPHGSNAAADYYERRRISKHGETVARHVASHAEASSPALLYRQPAFVLPGRPDESVLPDGARAILTVNESGRVNRIRYTQGIPDRLMREIAQSIRHWFFLPAVENGMVVSSTVYVPIVLDGQ